MQALRNLVSTGVEREGVVVKPMVEMVDRFGDRVIYKHLNAQFSEFKSGPKLNEKLNVIIKQNEILDQWVTVTRMEHVLSHLEHEPITRDIPLVADAFVADVKRESQILVEFEWTGEIEKALKKASGELFARVFLHLPGNK